MLFLYEFIHGAMQLHVLNGAARISQEFDDGARLNENPLRNAGGADHNPRMTAHPLKIVSMSVKRRKAAAFAGLAHLRAAGGFLSGLFNRLDGRGLKISLPVGRRLNP